MSRSETAPQHGRTLDFTRIRAVLFDMDGVIYRGPQPLPGVDALLHFLEQIGVTYACITNNATRTRQQFSERLESMHIHVPRERIITSSTATSVWLRERAPRGTRIYAIGMDGLRNALFADGYFVDEPTQPEYVVVGADFELTYAKLKTACLAIRAGATFVGTNPDTTFPSDEGIIPGAGAVIAALEVATGCKAKIIGKPERTLFDAALHLLHADPSQALVVGDRLDTDILGAQRAGIPSALVLTGVSSMSELDGSTIQPDGVFVDLPDLLAAWRRRQTGRA